MKAGTMDVMATITAMDMVRATVMVHIMDMKFQRKRRRSSYSFDFSM